MKKTYILFFLFVICLILCACKSDVANVETLIEKIGTITPDSEDAIVVAENAYAELTEEQQLEVKNYDVLIESREKYDILMELIPAQEFAAKLLTGCAKAFSNPLSIKVKNVWIWKHNLMKEYHITYELEAQNGLGNNLTVFYGTDTIGFDDLSDQELSSAVSAFSMGIDYYIVENGIVAMQNGILVDAVYIQDYFLKNYGK